VAERASDLFTGLGSGGRDTRLAGTRGIVRFDVRGAGSWRVHLDDGRYAVERGGGDCDLSIGCDEADFVHVMLGSQNFVTALLQNRFEASGDVALLLRLNVVLQSRAQERSQRADVLA
jgi:hypothetical protein